MRAAIRKRGLVGDHYAYWHCARHASNNDTEEESSFVPGLVQFTVKYFQ